MWFEQGLDKPVCDFDDIQQHAVDAAKDGDVFVEVGCFVGESMAALIDKVKASGKDIDLYAVDLFDIAEMCKDGGYDLDTHVMTPQGLTPRKWIDQHGPYCMLRDFCANLGHAGRDLFLTDTLIGRSVEMAAHFDDMSLRFCFIDAGHSYDNVLADLIAWYPKMRDDVPIFFAGHDWHASADVRRAVSEFAKSNGMMIGTTQSSWILKRIPIAE
jgi:methyltransferase family protein